MTDKSKVRIVFAGTPEFGANALLTLINLGYIPCLVITKQDKHKDKKGNIIYSPVKQIALEYSIPLIQPDKVGSIYQYLKQLNPDMLITAAYGQIIPENILSLFKLGCWNLHGSLLPQLRGGAPIHMAIVNGHKATGVSLMQMVKEMDAGGVVDMIHVDIENNDTYTSLLDKLMIVTQTIIKNNIDKLIRQEYDLVQQDHPKATYAYNITSKDQLVDWCISDIDIDRKIRGLYNKPLAKIMYCDKLISVGGCFLTQECSNAPVGTIVRIDKKGIMVVCGNQKIIGLNLIQLPGKRMMSVNDIINGHHMFKENSTFTHICQKNKIY